MSIAKWDKLYLLADLRRGQRCSMEDHFTLIPIVDNGKTLAPKMGELYYAEIGILPLWPCAGKLIPTGLRSRPRIPRTGLLILSTFTSASL